MDASEAVVLAVRVALAAAFAVAAHGKVTHPARTRATVAAFGVPGALARLVAAAVALVDGAVAVLLVVAPVAGAVAALAALAAYTAATARTLARGRRPECHCFGGLSRGAIGARTIVRNAALAVAASVMLLGGHDTATVVVVAPTVVLAGVLLALGRRRDAALLIPGPALVLFVEPGCVDCERLGPEVDEWRREQDGPAVVSITDPGRAAALGLTVAPGAVLVDERGVVVGGPVAGPDEVRRLWRAAAPPQAGGGRLR